MEAAVHNINEPKYLRLNWGALLATAPEHRSELKMIRVDNGVASITNGSMIIRSPVNAKDGNYALTPEGELDHTQYDHWLKYPDVNVVRPEFGKPFCQIHKKSVHEIMNFCEAVHQNHGTIVFRHDRVYMRQNHNNSYVFPFKCPNERTFDPKYIKLALKEMLRYDFIYMSQENRDDAPLIFGHDWGKCALVMPHRRDYG